MKFKDVEMLPGVIIDVEDPKKLGRVKATVPGLFDTSTMDQEGLPWIYPLIMPGYQYFSKMMTGVKIWVLKQENNYKEFWYFPMFELNQNTRDIIVDYDYPEILVSRNIGDASVLIYYTDKDGIMLKLGEETIINIKSDTSIALKAGNAQIDLKEGNVYIGNGNAEEHGVLGDSLKTALSNLSSNLLNVAGAAAGSPYTMALKAPLEKAANDLSSDVEKILCNYTFVE